MITIAKGTQAATEAIAQMRPILECIADGMNLIRDNAALTSHSLFMPSKLSVVDHEGMVNRFHMEIGFEQGETWTVEKRQEHSMRLLAELEDLFTEYGVITLKGDYHKYGSAQ